MKVKSIIIGFLIASLLTACSSSPKITDTSFEQDIVQIDDLEIKLVNHGIIEDNNSFESNQKLNESFNILETDQLNELFNNLETDQLIYLTEVEISSQNLDHTLDFSATDSNGNEIRPAFRLLIAGKPEICKVYFVIDKDTEISKFNAIIEKGGKVSTHSFSINYDND